MFIEYVKKLKNKFKSGKEIEPSSVQNMVQDQSDNGPSIVTVQVPRTISKQVEDCIKKILSENSEGVVLDKKSDIGSISDMQDQFDQYILSFYGRIGSMPTNDQLKCEFSGCSDRKIKALKANSEYLEKDARNRWKVKK